MKREIPPQGMQFDPQKIAIVIPLYNDAPNIARAMESAIAQETPPGMMIEVIVVDDCSTDDGPAIAQEIASRYTNVRALKQDKNGGPSVARNRALAETNAAWFTPLDSDDFMKPDRISKLVSYALENELDFVADNLLISYIDTPETVERNLWPGKPQGDITLTADFFVSRCLESEVARSELGFLHPLVNRAAMKDGEAPYKNELRFGEDFELYTRLLIEGAKAKLVDPYGYYLVQRPASASNVQSGDDHEKLARIGRGFLKRPNLDKATRTALARHVAQSEKEWAWWQVIDGVKARAPWKVLSAFGISLSASLHVANNLFEQILVRGSKQLKRNP